MAKEKILIVEDDGAILTGLKDLLQSEGYIVCTAQNGKTALECYNNEKPQLILLDIMIPEKSGYEVCQEIRKDNTLVPIVMLTAKGQEVDKVVGLELGADDYIVKPFGIQELLARIRAALRRAKNAHKKKEPKVIDFGDVQIDAKTLKGKKGNKTFKISKRELDMLMLFFAHKGEVVDRFTLLEEIWGIRYEGTTRTLDQHIAKLRQKIEDDPAQPQYIRTVHTVGYSFCVDS